MFHAASIGDAGEVVIRAAKTNGQVGLWRFSPLPGGASTVAVTGVTGVPELPTAQFDALGFQLLHAPNYVVVINGRLASGIGGVNSDNDYGIWLDVDGQQSLLTREQLTAPDVPGAQFRLPNATAINNQAQAAVLGYMIDGIEGVTSANALGIWRISDSEGDLIARLNVGGVAGVPGGVWLHDGADGEVAARSGAAAPGVAGASFAAFGAPLLNDSGQILFPASLVEGTGGVTAANAHGLWIVQPEGESLVARTGSGGVPGVPGADFASFSALAFNDVGVAAVQASLANVNPGTDEGLWLLDETGNGVLVARTGDVVGTRTIAALEFTGGSGGGDGRQQALNSNGQLVYKATFTNGDEGLFLYSSAAAADFNSDSHVDGADLLNWRIGFGQATGAGRAQGDADRDGDVDGADFLLWQQQLYANVPLAAVPEPSLAALLLPVGLARVLRLRRGVRPAR